MNLENYALDASYLNLENYAFDASYSNLENYACRLPINKISGLPINKIASTLCIYKIFNVHLTC